MSSDSSAEPLLNSQTASLIKMQKSIKSRHRIKSNLTEQQADRLTSDLLDEKSISQKMKYASTVLITLISMLLAVVSFLHVHSDDHSFFLTSIAKVEKGMTEAQRYVQYSGDANSLLFGYRHQIKQGDRELPRIRLLFKSKTNLDRPATKETPKEGKEREYTFGFSKWTTGDKSSDFYGSYTFVKFWVIELFLILLIMIFGLPFVIPLIRKKGRDGVIPSESLPSST